MINQLPLCISLYLLSCAQPTSLHLEYKQSQSSDVHCLYLHAELKMVKEAK